MRGRRRAELTHAGSILVQGGRKLLSASHELIELVQRRAAGHEGIVRIDVLVRHLQPRLMRPMVVAYRAAPAANKAVANVLKVLAGFALKGKR